MESESAPKKLIRLAKRALEQTRSGRVTWSETDDPDAFIFSGTQTSIVVDYYPARNAYELKVLNTSGTTVEEVMRGYRAVDPNGWPAPDPAVEQEANEYALLSDLHAAARRSALNIDSLLDSAFSDLNGGPDEPPF